MKQALLKQSYVLKGLKVDTWADFNTLILIKVIKASLDIVLFQKEIFTGRFL